VHRLFISDLHLSEDTPKIEAALEHLLSDTPLPDSLVILGDFFEAWIGDDDDAPLANRLRELLYATSRRGCEISIARGNRDFMLGQRFADDVGASLLGDETQLEVAGNPAVLLHGDTLCTDDKDYQQFRAMVHDAGWQTEMMAKGLEERRELARQLRALSIDAASNKPEDIMDVNPEAVQTLMANSEARLIVHGHTHRPARHLLPTGERIVLGDWSETHGWLLRERGESLSLEQFIIH
jgi:UDP-2,3-diacylglucosamine hydrolase